MSCIVDSAFELAERGYCVFPVRPRDKRPLTAHGFKDAIRDPERISCWWKEHPDANIGVATGRNSNLVVLDVDGAQGVESLKGSCIPPTATLRTGRAQGFHHWFRSSGLEIQGRTGILPGVDVKAEGGYVIAPPSVHKSGRLYEWLPGLSPEEVGLADCPDWLLSLAEQETIPKTSHDWAHTIQEGVAEGARHTSLCSLAGLLLCPNLSAAVVEEILQVYNQARCRPPLPPEEVSGIVRGIATREVARRARS